MSDKGSEGKKNGRLLRILKVAAKIDWKGMALVLGALGGCGGAVWNQASSWLQQAHDERTQAGAYELLAQRVDELYERMDACEATQEPVEGSTESTMGLDKGVQHKPTPPEAVPAASPQPAPPPPDEVAAMIEAIMESAPPEPVAYKRSRLPSFDAIQQNARQLEDMEIFMEEMKAR